ncbi:hypothetical protein Ciccas_006810 [Cichlidogyrus casuarinus]|uniref:Uncharacterized protein n=1 Tax=Cichlidogyrus casuarinus TaxID=1844966 RepID=A0ABD2Q8J9_9PLAT
MIWHSKALEMFSNCYEALQEIDVNEDLTDFNNSLLGGSLNSTPNHSRSVPSDIDMASSISKIRNSSSSLPVNLNHATELHSEGEEEEEEEDADDEQADTLQLGSSKANKEEEEEDDSFDDDDSEDDDEDDLDTEDMEEISRKVTKTPPRSVPA